MNAMIRTLSRIAAAIALLAPQAILSQFQAATEYEHAVEAWDKGNYPDALARLMRIMRSTDAPNYRDRIALLTGELFRTTELALDGRLPRWSPDGRWAAFETGASRGRVTRIVAISGPPTVGLQVSGAGLVFSSNGQVAYLDSTDALVLRDLPSGTERRMATAGRLVASLIWSSDGRALYAVGVDSANQRGTRIFAIDDEGAVTTIADDDSVKTAVVAIPGGRFLMYAVGGRSPFARGPQGGPPPQASGFALLDLTTRTTRFIVGSAPTASADGTTIAWAAREGGDYTIVTMSLTDGAPVVARRATYPLAAPALSPNGARVAYQVQANHDWEIYVADRDGKNELRLTREIQHDLQPRFLDANRVFAVMGEARHRRSYLLRLDDFGPPTRTRLFHNNTVRTIAPEYEWAPSPDGAKILIVAERDGDTVSPERGVFLFDMSDTVSSAEVRERLARMSAAERDLRTLTTRAFAPIAADVRARVAEVSVPRIYAYEKALFDFDSKHVTRPGNALAVDYLTHAYRSFGYEPELQTFQARVGGQQSTTTVPTSNVIATLRGTVNPELVYVVGSHFDSRAEGPGADDNTSGTAALLEAARVLSKHPQPATIVFVSFSAEESGLLGSREFARVALEKKWKVVGALNNDMLGWTNDHRLDNTIRYSNPGIRDVQHGAAIGFTDMITYDALYYKSTDAAAMYDAWGDIVGGIGSYPVLGNPHYHQSHDNLEVENHQLIAEASKTTVATLMLLASSPSRVASLTAMAVSNGATALTWAPSPEAGVRRYFVRVSSNGREDRTTTVTAPRTTLNGIRVGDVVAVKAVNAKGMEGWDWARITLK